MNINNDSEINEYKTIDRYEGMIEMKQEKNTKYRQNKLKLFNMKKVVKKEKQGCLLKKKQNKKV